jgi:hypothetical protein
LAPPARLHLSLHQLGETDPLKPLPADAPNLGEAEMLVNSDVLGQARVRAQLELRKAASGRFLLGKGDQPLAEAIALLLG